MLLRPDFKEYCIMATESVQYDLKELVETDMQLEIPKPLLFQVLSNPPFVPVPGIINLRDLGMIPSSPIRRGLIYRSGALHNVPPSSLTQLKDGLGLKLILDLRTEREITRSPNPTMDGVHNMHFDSLRAPTPIAMEKFVEEGGRNGYVEMYVTHLDRTSC